MEDEAIPVVVNDESELPEGLANYYQQGDDGSFVLKAKGVDSHPEVQNLRNSLQRQKQDREKLRKERDQYYQKASLIPDDLDNDTLQDVLERARNGGDGGHDQQGKGRETGDGQRQQQGQDPARIRQQVEQRFQKEIEQRDQRLQEKNQQVRQLVTDQSLTTALQKHGINNPTYQKAAKKLLADQITLQDSDDGMPQPVVESDMGEMSLDDFVQRWVNSDEGAAFVAGNTGSGAPGGKTGGGKTKQLKRSQFDAMSPEDKRQFALNGGQIVDG